MQVCQLLLIVNIDKIHNNTPVDIFQPNIQMNKEYRQVENKTSSTTQSKVSNDLIIKYADVFPDQPQLQTYIHT